MWLTGVSSTRPTTSLKSNRGVSQCQSLRHSMTDCLRYVAKQTLKQLWKRHEVRLHRLRNASHTFDVIPSSLLPTPLTQQTLRRVLPTVSSCFPWALFWQRS